MNYSGIIYDDIANGYGIRTSLFVSGCRNHCPGCFNQDQQDFNYGKPFNQNTIDIILDSINDVYHDGISILGGDPMEPENAKELIELAKQFRDKYNDRKTIWLYTGYIYEDIINNKNYKKALLEYCDIVVDGPFIESLKNISLKFKGSSNQRIIKVKDSIINNEIILWEDE